MIRRLAISFLILVSCSILVGQKILDFEKLSIDDGFTSSKANAIIQDSKGYIWIGTWNGLNRYDGYEVETFRPLYHDTSSISNREVLALIEDKNKDIWVGTTSGLNCYKTRTKEWEKHEFHHRIISLLEDSEGFIWVGTWGGGLYKLDPRSGEMEHYLENETVSDIHEDSNNNLWIATYYGLINLDRNNSSFVRFLPDREKVEGSIGHIIITQIEESDDETLWLGTWGGGLERVDVRQDRDSIRFTQYRVRDGVGSISSNVIYRLHFDSYGNLWIGTWDGGLSLIEKSQQTQSPQSAFFSTYENDLRNAEGLSGNNISAVFVDRSGVLWVGSSMIERSNIVNSGVRRYKTLKISGGIYSQRNVRSFGKKDDLLWVGTTSDIMLYEGANGSLKHLRDIEQPTYNYNGANYISNSTLCYLTNSDGLWLGTEDAGLLFYPGKSAESNTSPEFEFYNTLTEPAIPGNKVCKLVESKIYPGVIWLGTLQNGFAKLTYVDGKAEVEDFDVGLSDNALSDNNVRAILEDRDGLVWIGTQNGLNCFNPETRVFHKYFYNFSDTTAINDDVINVLYEDQQGNLWIGTNAGVNKKIQISQNDIRFKGFPEISGISDEIVTNILEDYSGNLWVGLYQRLVKINIQEEVIEKVYSSIEYQHLVIERNSAVRDETGFFYFGGENGFLCFHPDSLLRNSLPPKVCITDLIVFNESVEDNLVSEKNNGGLINAISYREELSLPYKSKILTFVFSAMDYKDPKKNIYSYRLEGFDKQWNEVGTRNIATYTNIRPGKYVFLVRAANSDGVWSENPAEFRLTIKAPWWQTKVALLLYALLMIGLLYTINQYSIIGVREKSRIMIEHMNYEKEHELNEEKTNFFTNITHEFRTPLTLILGPAEELLKSKDLSAYENKQAGLIQRNAQRLLRLVNQLMEFRKVERGKMEIYLRKTDIVALLNDLYESFRSMADAKGIKFMVNFDKREIEAMIDSEKFEKVLFNLVSNAFKFSEEGSKITIWAGIVDQSDKEPRLVLEIEDTGIGISEEHKEKVFERFFQANQLHTQSTGGIGLYLSKTFVEMHGGSIELESELGQGSCFRVVIPAVSEVVKVQDTSITSEEELAAAHEEIEEEKTSDSMHFSIDNARPSILIVEDDSELNDFMVDGLSKDFTAIGSKDGQEGLEIARKLMPDIIITDIMMPLMDGMEMTRILRKDLSTSHIPVVFLTAKTMREDELKGLKIGAVDYIYKPFNLEALRLKIHNLLESRNKIHERIRTEQLLEPEHIELSSLDEKFLKDAVEAVNKNLDDPSFDVEKFSYDIGISANQAYRKIKALTGQTAKEFIRNQRLKTAADLLLQKRRSISEIIYMVGFSSPSYFTRCFKDYYGYTPKEYIEKNGIV